MFRATMGPSSGETGVFVWHLVLVILCGWLSGMQEHILTPVSPDEGPIVARNMQRLIDINILRKIVHQDGFIYEIIQRCTSQQNIKYTTHLYCTVPVKVQN